MPAPQIVVSRDSFAPAGAPTPSGLRRSALQRGMTGGLVRELQRHLVAEGHLRAADAATGPGVFGPRTETAVKAFQQSEGLPVTGMVGPQTWAALLDDGFQPARPQGTVTEVPKTLDTSVTRPLEASRFSSTRSVAARRP
jgi:peptidoglycan hydrolase-like protein with peptidoglycan-binding domain